MADSFYYQANGQTIGPLAPSALKQLANEGVIGEATLVRRGEQGAWCEAGTIAGLISPRPAGGGAAAVPAGDSSPRACRCHTLPVASARRPGTGPVRAYGF